MHAALDFSGSSGLQPKQQETKKPGENRAFSLRNSTHVIRWQAWGIALGHEAVELILVLCLAQACEVIVKGALLVFKLAAFFIKPEPRSCRRPRLVPG